MFLIEPCCTQRHIPELYEKLGEDGTCLWHGNGDLSLAELLPELLTRYGDTKMMIVAPRIPDGAARVLKQVMDRQWATTTGDGKIHAVGHMTLVTDLSKKKSPLAAGWLKENPWGERLTLKNVQQNDTVIILPDIAIQGNINLVYGGHFVALATRNARLIAQMRGVYDSL